MKANPGGVGYATSGVGHEPARHRRMVQARRPGIKLDHVPYRGAGQAINDLIAGHVKVAFLGPTALVPHYQAGNLRLLAQSSSARAPTLAGDPDARGGGLQRAWCSKPGMRPSFRPGTPAAIVARLNAEMAKALVDPKLLRDLHQGRGRAGRRQRRRARASSRGRTRRNTRSS